MRQLRQGLGREAKELVKNVVDVADFRGFYAKNVKNNLKTW